MNWLRIGLVWFALLPAGAATLDLIRQPAQTLHSGDVLTFLFSSRSFALHAGNMGTAIAPTSLAVDFTSLPAGPSGRFSAGIQSADGSLAAPFAQPLIWQPADFNGSLYQGPVSALDASLRFPESVSRQIFAGGTAVLSLSYIGPDQTIGVPGYTLSQDMAIGLSGGPVTVGAQILSVTLETSGEAVLPASSLAAPEPGPEAILLACGGLLCVIATLLKRFSGTDI